jgi:hypothetical protein
MMQFPVSPDEEHEFYQFIHMHSIGYDFPGGYRMLRRNDQNVEARDNWLWYVEDSIGFRLTCEGLWVGEPREYDDKRRNWLADTSHEFKDAYELLVRVCGTLPALRRPRPVRV